MQIIENWSLTTEVIYCGAIGYVGFDGDMDSSLVTRNLIYSDGGVRCWGAVVLWREMTALLSRVRASTLELLVAGQPHRHEF